MIHKLKHDGSHSNWYFHGNISVLRYRYVTMATTTTKVLLSCDFGNNDPRMVGYCSAVLHQMAVSSVSKCEWNVHIWDYGLLTLQPCLFQFSNLSAKHGCGYLSLCTTNTVSDVRATFSMTSCRNHGNSHSKVRTTKKDLSFGRPLLAKNYLIYMDVFAHFTSTHFLWVMLQKSIKALGLQKLEWCFLIDQWSCHATVWWCGINLPCPSSDLAVLVNLQCILVFWLGRLT